ncbi:P-loop NTPase [Spirochaeta cellobiosiphila]|uniref:P-loop NTPase n=1 Tax=Spirochaeta cellobiosiphila TaxID=504483 RepID=UPI0003FE27CD|nr:P-loop NTPase [Spirochaeta cellobiosiphila]
MHIIPIASGKGGVGKSTLSANLAIALAETGKKVILTDLDLGASNLHHILGIRAIPQGIGNFLSNSKLALNSLVMETEYAGLFFLPGDSEIPGVANLKASQKSRLIKALKGLDCDFLILDLGAGSSFNTLDFFLMSSHGIIVSTPTLTATLNAYLFLKNTVFRILSASFKKGSIAADQLDKAFQSISGLQKIYLPKFLETIRKEDPESYNKFYEKIKHFRPRLVFNMLDDPKDVDKADKIRRSTKEYLGVDLEHLGIIYRDEIQKTALGSRLPIIVYKPQSIVAQAMYRIADKVLQLAEEDDGNFEIDSIDDTYLEAAYEAEVDFNAKLQDVEALLNTGALTMGDLVETIRVQQLELNQIKKENLLLKSKILRAAKQGFKV